MKGIAIKYSADELAWIKANQKGITRKELTERFNRTFDRTVATDNIKALCLRKGWLNGNSGYFKKGEPSWNKGKTGYMGANITSFQKGRTPHNHKPVGSSRVTPDGYTEIKTAEPNQWELAHRLEWEKHHGKPEKGCVIAFKDGDKNNFHIDNLMQISRETLATTNKLRPNCEPELKETAYLIYEVSNQAKQRGKNNE